MKFIRITFLLTSVFTSQAIAVAVSGAEVQELAARQGRPVAFNVAPLGTPCGHGTTISCAPSPGSPCKGNFNPKQASIVVTEAAGNCHVSLYPQNNQAGGVIQRLDTDTTGTCVFTSVAEYQSYGIFCD
ncbi:hypothetical protein GALMADRAFT_160467 [Galerina marginata CBS 339.88]|uniref:Uncharacterized protein n=1 Tax=Galerina marginata (strain CBS 339.88) TaxID=685588 RepID=A0A067SP86_GALM3|nr:hypothetical protein GALMADRAFT_160467 [Galerina marginata CBS 339.88]